MIRKSAVIIIAIIALLIGAFVFLLGNSFVENVTEMALGKIFNVEVDIDGLDIDPLEMKVSFEELNVADPTKSIPYIAKSNTAEFDVLGMQLLAKKLVINKMKLNDLYIDTAERKAVKKESKDSKEESKISVNKVKELASQLPELDFDILTKELDIDEYVHPEKLESVKAIKEIEQSGSQKIDKWKNIEQTTSVKSDIKELENDFKNLQKSNPKTIPQFQQALKDLQNLQKKAQKTQTEISQIHKDANTDLQSISTDFGNIKSLTENDIKGAEKLANIKDVNAKHIGMMLFGREMVNRFDQATGILQTVRGFFGEKREAPKRKQGRFVNFPVTSTVYPQFLVSELSVNGILTKQAKPQVTWSGSIRDFTTEQTLTGKPTVFDFKGKKVDDPTKYHLQGILDNRNKDESYQFILNTSDMVLKQIALKEGDKTWPNHLNSNDAELILDLGQTKDEISGTLKIIAHSVQFAFADVNPKKLSESDRLVRDLFADLKDVEIKSVISGKISDPKFSVSSNIDDIIAKRLDNLIGEKIAEIRERIRKQIEFHTNEAREKVESYLNAEKQKILAQLNGYKSQANSQKERIEKEIENTRNRIDGEANKAKREAERRKKELERQAQQEAERKKKELEQKSQAESEKKKKELEKNLKSKIKGFFN